jgi:hypothetical protein
MNIKYFPNYYCDINGNVFSKKKKLKQSKRNGYLCVSLCHKGLCKSINVHRIIAETFIPNPYNKKQVNHINGIKTDNRVENLEWVSHSENMIHAITNGLFLPPQKNRLDLSKEVYQYDLQGKFIAKFPSCNEASRLTGISQRHISSCARGGEYRISGGVKKFVKTNSAGGYKWYWQEVKEEIEKL